jgi:hypothetical protein
VIITPPTSISEFLTAVVSKYENQVIHATDIEYDLTIERGVAMTSSRTHILAAATWDKSDNWK